MPRSLHIAAAQIHSAGPIENTLHRIDRQAACAAAVGCELILFAEGSLHGYDYGMTSGSVGALAEPLTGPSPRRIRQQARRHGLVMLVGFFERLGDAVFNSMLVAYPDGRLETARKYELTDTERMAGITPSQRERAIIEINGVRCAIVICADDGMPNLYDDLRAQCADYRLCPTGGGGRIEDMLHETDLSTPQGLARYIENRPRVFKPEATLTEANCPFSGFTSANALGPVGKETCHQGHCMIVDNHRVMRAQIPGTIVLEHMQDQLIHASLTF